MLRSRGYVLACYLLRVTLPATVAGGFASRCAASCAEVTHWPLLTSRYTFCYRSRWVRLAVRCAPRGVRAVMRWSATITSRHTYCYCGRGCASWCAAHYAEVTPLGVGRDLLRVTLTAIAAGWCAWQRAVHHAEAARSRVDLQLTSRFTHCYRSRWVRLAGTVSYNEVLAVTCRPSSYA
jgi:hypothetical protein